MAQEPDKGANEPNLELPSLLGFGRKRKRKGRAEPTEATEAPEAPQTPVPAPDTAASGSEPPVDTPAVVAQAPVTEEPVARRLPPVPPPARRPPPVPPPPAAPAAPPAAPVSATEETRVLPAARVEPPPAEPTRVEPAPAEPAPVEPAVSSAVEPPTTSEAEELQRPVEPPPPMPAVETETPASGPVEPLTTPDPVHPGAVGGTAGTPATAAVAPREVPVAAHADGPVGGATAVQGGQPAQVVVLHDEAADDVDPAPRQRRSFRLPAVDSRLAVALTGLVVGLLSVVLSWTTLRGCEVVRGVGSCGGIGLFALLAIVAIEIVLGAVMLRLWGITDPTGTSFLGVGLVAVVALLFFLSSLESSWMLLVIPLLSAVAFLVSWWVTTSFVEVGDSPR